MIPPASVINWSSSRLYPASPTRAVVSLMRQRASVLIPSRGRLASGSLAKKRPRKPSAEARPTLVGTTGSAGSLSKRLASMVQVRKSTLRCRPGAPRLVCQRCRSSKWAAEMAPRSSTPWSKTKSSSRSSLCQETKPVTLGSTT